MEPKFRISNIVPNVPESRVLVWYVFDSGEIESHYFALEGITLEKMMVLGLERQSWFEQRAVDVAALQVILEEVTHESEVVE